jgi:hypothetical protein
MSVAISYVTSLQLTIFVSFLWISIGPNSNASILKYAMVILNLLPQMSKLKGYRCKCSDLSSDSGGINFICICLNC